MLVDWTNLEDWSNLWQFRGENQNYEKRPLARTNIGNWSCLLIWVVRFAC